MPKTHAQLLREIAVLQAAADKQRKIEAQGAVAKINDMIAKFGITAADLKFASGAPESAPTQRAAAATRNVQKVDSAKPVAVAAKRAARYSDGQGNEWGGRGPRPAWLRAALAAGQTLESLLSGAAPTSEAPASAVAGEMPQAAPSAKAAASSKADTPKPAARKARAKKATAGLDAIAAPPAVAVETEAKAPARKAVARKVAAKKVAARKSLAEKVGASTQDAGAKPAKPVVKAAAKKAVKTVAKKAASKKAASKKTATPKVAASKKSLPARKSAIGATTAAAVLPESATVVPPAAEVPAAT
ncbi:H-NS histone family protein [Variovorax robiniae]|uniref:H-NS histone family protein n=1 Tax=Variovorax robiniae TaxID=1836199 RepID=A0ABU8XJB8_9BURK